MELQLCHFQGLHAELNITPKIIVSRLVNLKDHTYVKIDFCRPCVFGTLFFLIQTTNLEVVDIVQLRCKHQCFIMA